MDAYKLCKLARKPTPRATRDIGAWYLAFSLTSAVSVMTNCALLAMDKDVQVRKVKMQDISENNPGVRSLARTVQDLLWQ